MDAYNAGTPDVRPVHPNHTGLNAVVSNECRDLIIKDRREVGHKGRGAENKRQKCKTPDLSIQAIHF